MDLSPTGKMLTPGSMYIVISADVTIVNWGELICQLRLPLQMSRYCFSEMLKRWTEKEGVKKPWNVWRKLSSVIGRMDKYGPDIGQKLRGASGVGESHAISQCMHLHNYAMSANTHSSNECPPSQLYKNLIPWCEYFLHTLKLLFIYVA